MNCECETVIGCQSSFACAGDRQHCRGDTKHTLRSNIRICKVQTMKFGFWTFSNSALKCGQKKSAFDVHWVVSRNSNNVLSLASTNSCLIPIIIHSTCKCTLSFGIDVVCDTLRTCSFFFVFSLHPLMRLSILNKRPAPFDIELGLNTLFFPSISSLCELAHLIEIRCWNAICTLCWSNFRFLIVLHENDWGK